MKEGRDGGRRREGEKEGKREEGRIKDKERGRRGEKKGGKVRWAKEKEIIEENRVKQKRQVIYSKEIPKQKD